MTKQPERARRVEIVRASREQQSVLDNLLQLYAHDFSEFYDVDLGPDGRFVYEKLPLYWQEGNRHPFLIWVDRKLAGFALVKQGSEVSGDETTWDLAEFFVTRGFRRRCIGTKAARQLWMTFPGRWEVRVLQSNQSAQPFWSHAIAEFTGKAVDPVSFEKDGEAWFVFSFVSGLK
jgi:predicted acetyltransferase